MIRSFRHRGLEAFFTRDDSRKVPADRLARITRLLDRLEVSRMLQDMNLPGFDFHRLKGNRKGIYAVSVSGNWRLTFRFEAEHASDVDLEDYH
ncbi:MAG: type II toxin-antitoxin system RelE/ParE family toxin [Steroidobacteraceae bacterium]